MTALPKFMYGDPMLAAMRNEAREAKGCNSCAFSESVFGRKLCIKGKKHTSRCDLYIDKGGIKK